MTTCQTEQSQSLFIVIRERHKRRQGRRIRLIRRCLYNIMKQLDSLAKYWEEEEFRSHLVINYNISVFLDCCESVIRADCGVTLRNKQTNKKKEAPRQFKEAFTALSREEKVEYYLRVMGYMRNFMDDIFNAPISTYSGVLCDMAWSHSFKTRRWKQKKFRLDHHKHLLFAERSSKIATFDLKDYILRVSKNKDYHSLVLLAANSYPSEKYRSVHIGFTDKAKFQLWFDSLKFSTEFREWQFFCSLYKGHITNIPDISAHSPSPPHKSKNKLNMSFTAPKKVDQEDDDQLSYSLCANNTGSGTFADFRMPEKKIFKQRQEFKKEQVQNLQREIKKYEQKKDLMMLTKTMIGELIEGDIIEETEHLEERIEEEDEHQKELKRCLDLFHKLYPQYELSQLEAYSNFSSIHEQPSFRIYQSQVNSRRFKMTTNIRKQGCTLLQMMSQISKPQTAKSVNSNIEELQIKTYIPSENSALLYLVLRPFNRLYRARDFVFIRHVFRQGAGLYMVDKSIENTNYPPFLTIVRGSLCIVYGLFERQDCYELIVDVEMSNEGYLNAIQESNLTLNFLRPFSKLIQFSFEPTSYRLFDFDWDITKNELNHYEDQIRNRQKTIKKLINGPQKEFFDARNEVLKTNMASPENSDRSKSDKQKQEECKFQDVIENNEELVKSTIEEEGQINADDLLKAEQVRMDVVRQLNHLGYIMIDPSFRTRKYPMHPLDKRATKLIFLESIEGHPIWRKDWLHDDKMGGLIFINQKKIEDQKGVLRFILTKMAKNLVSGQSILNVSLPVDIFCAESNLQSFIRSMVYAPMLLQGLEKADALTRLLRTIAFGITNSVIYLNMEKPFNPQIGQTFQCFINGCPAYGEQISHHPPIAALLLKGRGYDVSAQLQSKMSVGVNSGTGTNDGIYRVLFDDQMEVCFITPGGQVSGLAHGDRKFNFVGKSYYWVPSANLVLELVFDPYRKGFFSVGKQQQPSDYFQGNIWEVRPDFISKFAGAKRREPTEKERVRSLGKVSGTWNKNVLHNGVEVFSLEREMPLAIEHEAIPLPSDSNWREDIQYRRRNQITRAQIEKERLEVQQRRDRKLREKKRK